LQGWTIDSGRLPIWFQLGHSLKIRSISRFVRRQPDRLRRRRLFDGRRCYGRLTGVQDDLFRPFARRPDPDDRSIDGQLIVEHRWGRWQTPAGDEQQSRKRSSDEDKVAGYGHRLSLLQIEQFRLAHDRDTAPPVRRENIDS
jgi:hypothetical protein